MRIDPPYKYHIVFPLHDANYFALNLTHDSLFDGGNDPLIEEPRSKLVLSQIGRRSEAVASTTIEADDVPGEFRLDSSTTPNANTRFARLDVDRGRLLSPTHPLPCQLEVNDNGVKVDLRGDTDGREGSDERVIPLRSGGRSSNDTPRARSPALPASVLDDLAMTHRADSEHCLVRSTQATAAPATTFDKDSPSPAAVSRRKEDRDVFTAGPTRLDLFTPPLSVPRGNPACHSSHASREKGTRSPVSNRIDVLQTLLAPAGNRKGDRDEENIARSVTNSVAKATAGVGGGSGGSWSGVNDNNVDALENFLQDNTIHTAIPTTSKDDIPVGANVAAAAGGGHDDHLDVDRHTANRQGHNINITDFGTLSNDDVDTDRRRDDHPRQALSNTSPRTRTPASSSVRRTSVTTIEREHWPGVGAGPTDYDEATAAQPNNFGVGSEDPGFVSFAPGGLGKGLQRLSFGGHPAVGDGGESESGRMGFVQGVEAGKDRHQMEELQVCGWKCYAMCIALDDADGLTAWADISLVFRRPNVFCVSVAARGGVVCTGMDVCMRSRIL